MQSALGEPLKAEIDILDINAEEAASLSTKVAGPESFKTAGLEYNAAMTSLRATLQRRPDGRAYIKLSSDRAINDPFVDMILETSWNSGRIVRDYTMLFDPPSLRSSTANPPTTAQLPAVVPERATVAPPTTAKARTSPRDLPAATPVRPPAAVAKMPSASPAKPAAQQVPSGNQTVVVKAGDTAGLIAAANKPTSVSLDQMLVALLRANPDAFIRDNVNRIKAGAIVTLPSEEQAASTTPAQARQDIIAQSQDFNDFRRKFATGAPAAQVVPTSRDVSGKVQATVEDKKPTAATPDKLTLSKGAIQGKSSEDQLAQARNVKEAAIRAAELSKNLSDLGKLAAASSAATATAPASSSSAAKAALPIVATATAVSMPASAPTLAAAVSAPASLPAVTASVPASVPALVAASAPKIAASAIAQPAELPTEPGLLDTLMENPLLPAGAVGLIALLAGFGVYRAKQRKKQTQFDSSFLESRLLAESFSGASGGQSVDTSDNLTTGSSMVYSPSQLDAVDDVDPVAEADVYLAYGRDLQAEEILKDALRTNPQRLAIHQKLLDIYSKRHDAKAFESIATLAFNLTNGTGPEWEHICERGLAIDPDNALYLPGGQPATKIGAATLAAAVGAAAAVQAADTHPDATIVPAPEADGAIDLDLDLDFSPDEPDSEPTEPFSRAPELPVADFTGKADEAAVPLPTISEKMIPPVDASAAEPEIQTVPDPMAEGPDFSMPEPELGLSFADDEAEKIPPLPSTSMPHQTAPLADINLMSFDLGSLSLDLGDAPVTEPGAFVDDSQDPLETKLALADEFRAIGDDDGARALIEEVIAESSGDMKAKAHRALSKL